MLQGKGLNLATAVGLGAVVGPCQVAARTVEMSLAGRHHPVWTHIASVVLVVAGVAALWVGAPFIAFAMALYGAGIGLESIARGAMPLAIFGPVRYPIIMGRVAMPSLIAQAAAPSIGSISLGEAAGPDGTMAIISLSCGRHQYAAGGGPAPVATVFVTGAVARRERNPLIVEENLRGLGAGWSASD